MMHDLWSNGFDESGNFVPINFSLVLYSGAQALKEALQVWRRQYRETHCVRAKDRVPGRVL